MPKKKGPMERRLAELGARIDTFASPDVGRVIKKELTTARRSLDEIQVQMSLGKMEARDRIGEVRDGVERVLAIVERQLESFDDEPWDRLPDKIHLTEADVEGELKG